MRQCFLKYLAENKFGVEQKTDMKEKLKSRKLWMAIGGLLTVAATEWLNLSPELTEQVVSAVIIIVPAYIG